jgi:predicted ArsR family transcriptional regulator
VSSSTPKGPQPVRTDRPQGAALRVLQSLAKAPGPLTIADLSAESGGHPNRFRSQLEQLVAAGFVSMTTVAATRPGRPARAYEATVSGVQVALEQPTLEIQGPLIEALADLLSTAPDPTPTALALGNAWGRRLPRMGLVDALAAQGFTPAEEHDRIVLRTCPMLDAARRHPQVVCTLHQGLIQALAGEAHRLVPFSEPGACVILSATTESPSG